MKFKVTEKNTGLKLPLPANLSTVSRYRVEDAVNKANPRAFTLKLEQKPPYWLLNERTFEMLAVADNENVKLNDLEIWEFDNLPGKADGTMMETAHPMHVHGLQFQVFERTVRPENSAVRDSLSAGYTDEGWKDTILVMPGEKVRVLMKFEDYSGLYLYHCHNLEHEDTGMMRNFRINR